jgi:hypothetical protein
MGWTIGVLGFDSRRELGICLFTTASRTALGHTQPPIQWVPGALSLGVERPGRETDHSPQSRAEVNSAWSYTSTPPIRPHGVVLKHRDNFTFPLPRSSEWSLPYRFSDIKLVHISYPHACHMPRPSNLDNNNNNNNNRLNVHVTKFVTHSSPTSRHFVPV